MHTYGVGSASYEAAGGKDGLARLVDRFYDFMDNLDEAKRIRDMHEADLSLSREKLKVFLSAWLGGPNHYRERFGPIAIPAVHAHLAIDESERDAWLLCMDRAVAEQPWDSEFKTYFMRAIAVPAERVRMASVARRTAG